VKVKWSTIFTVLLLLATLLFGVEILALNPRARLAPSWVIWPTLLLLSVQLAFDLWPKEARALRQAILRSPPTGDDKSVVGPGIRSSGDVWEAFGWIALMFFSVLALSLAWGLAVFVLVYTLCRTSLPLWASGAITAALYVLLEYGLAALGIALPLGWMQRLLAVL